MFLNIASSRAEYPEGSPVQDTVVGVFVVTYFLGFQVFVSGSVNPKYSGPSA